MTSVKKNLNLVQPQEESPIDRLENLFFEVFGMTPSEYIAKMKGKEGENNVQ
jgi:hypothetical protein